LCRKRVLHPSIHIDNPKGIQMFVHSIIPTVGYQLSTAVFLRPVIRITARTPRVISITFYRGSNFIGQCDQRTLVVSISVHQAVFAVILHKDSCQPVSAAKIMNFNKMASLHSPLNLNILLFLFEYYMTLNSRCFNFNISLEQSFL